VTRHGTAKLAVGLSGSVAAAFASARGSSVPVTLTAKATIVTGRSVKVTRTITLRR
jgi:hypothetical protein